MIARRYTYESSQKNHQFNSMFKWLGEEHGISPNAIRKMLKEGL